MTTYVAFDTETTGVEPGSRLVELAAVAFTASGNVLGTFQHLVHPGMPMPPDASLANGIMACDLTDKPDAAAVLSRFFAWLPAGAILMAHNATFDQDIIGWECGRFELPQPDHLVLDTLSMARVVGGTPNNKLQTLVAHHRIAIDGSAHRALPDADAVRQLFLILHMRTNPRPVAWHSRYAYESQLPGSLECLPEAVATGASMTFSYTDAEGAKTRRTLTPYGWARTEGGLMIHGRCMLRNERRTFAVDRMNDIHFAGKQRHEL
jgi:DNA polymerase III epsilon subunit family exonuclease